VRRIDPIFLLILLAALALRLQLATSEPYIHDEENTSIPLAATISFAPGALHLPLRGENHGAMPAYVVKASRTSFGTSRVGTRLLHVLLGLATIALIFVMVQQWYGPGAARWAAALMAFNDYYLGVSSRATAHVPHLFFVTLAIYAFSRFLAKERPAYLYGAALSVGLAFYCKEHSALLLPVFFATLLRAKYRRWLWKPHVYLACALYVIVLAPDVIWNVETDPDAARVTYNNQTVGQATYAAHLRRIGGLGFSLYPAMFYERRPVMAAYQRVTGNELRDETPEYPSVNAVVGALLFGALVFTTFGAVPRDELRAFLLILAWGIFLFFTLIKKGNPPGRLDPVSWIWVEVTIIPAVMIAGARLAGLTGRWRWTLWVVAAAALLYACARPLLAPLNAGVGGAQEGASAVSHAIQVATIGTVDAVRNHPLRALFIASAGGALVGATAGFVYGRLYNRGGR
jgi:4-amino-4-deoxy-L-arabinose transferase-like glycosyltransferase